MKCNHTQSPHIPDRECAKITTVLLKSRTGEFDLESIMFLKLRKLGKMIMIVLSAEYILDIHKNTVLRVFLQEFMILDAQESV